MAQVFCGPTQRGQFFAHDSPRFFLGSFPALGCGVMLGRILKSLFEQFVSELLSAQAPAAPERFPLPGGFGATALLHLQRKFAPPGIFDSQLPRHKAMNRAEAEPLSTD